MGIFNEVAAGEAQELNARYEKYRERSIDQNAKFADTLPWLRVKDEGEYNGVYFSPRGFAFRVMYNDEDHTYMLWAAKGQANLRANVDEEGHMNADPDLLKNGYIISAYRLKECEGNKEAIFEKFAKDMSKYDREVGARSRHYRYKAVSFETPDTYHHAVDGAKYGVGYEVQYNVKAYAVNVLEHVKKAPKRAGELSSEYTNSIHYMSTQRDAERDHFLPVKPSARGPSVVKHKLAEHVDSEQARLAMDDHRRTVSEDVWEQRNLYKGNGTAFRVKSSLAGVVNYGLSHTKSMAVHGFMVGVVSVVHPEYTMLASVGTVAYHAAGILLADGVWDRIKENHKNRKDKNTYSDIGKTPFYKKDGSGPQNIAVYYQKGELKNLSKFSPKPDLERCKLESSVFCNQDDVNLLNRYVNARTTEDFEERLAYFLLRMHRLNLPIKEYDLDRNTRAFECDNTVSGVMHNRQDGSRVMYAMLNKDILKNEGLEVPDEYAKQFEEDSVVKIEYSRAQDGAHLLDEVQVKLRSDQAEHEVHGLLFRQQSYIQEWVKERSHQTITELFAPRYQPSMYEDYDPDDEARRAFAGSGIQTWPSDYAMTSAQDVLSQPLSQLDEEPETPDVV